VPELVEARREHRHHDHGQEQRRVAERLGGRGREPLVDQHPEGHRREGQHHRHDEHGREQHREGGGQPSGALRIGDRTAQPQREQGVRAPQLGLGPVRPAQQAERSQGALDELGDVLRPDQPAGGLPDPLGDLGEGPPPVDRAEHRVEQRRQGDDLPVPAPGERRGTPVARAWHLAEQLDAVGPGEDLLRLDRCRGHRGPSGVTAGCRTAGRRWRSRPRRCPAR
jgi:hypothetical protein